MGGPPPRLDDAVGALPVGAGNDQREIGGREHEDHDPESHRHRCPPSDGCQPRRDGERQPSHGKRLDLLAIDDQALLHAIELKRDQTPREVVAQALEYGWWVRTLTLDDEARPGPKRPHKGAKPSWNQRDVFMPLGRAADDPRFARWTHGLQYGFVGAGGGAKYWRFLRRLEPGVRVFAYVAGPGTSVSVR